MKNFVLILAILLSSFVVYASERTEVVIPVEQEQVKLGFGSYRLVFLKESYDSVADDYFVFNYDEMCEATFVNETDDSVIFDFDIMAASADYAECKFVVGTDFMRKVVLGFFDSEE